MRRSHHGAADWTDAPARPRFGAGLSGWLDRVLATRDLLLSSQMFQRWASAFPLTRPVARSRTRELFDLCAGFVYSQVLLACVRTRLCEALLDEPQTAKALSERCGLPLEGTERLLRAAIALRLVEHRLGGRYGVGPLGAALAGNPGITAMIEHHALLYEDLADPVALLKDNSKTALNDYWAYAQSETAARFDDEDVSDYSSLMAASQSFIANDVLDAYPMHSHRALLDVGGGEGRFAAAAAARHSGLKVTLFDLPPVAERARAQLDKTETGKWVKTVGGDFRADDLPGGADLISLIRILHDHDDADAVELLRAARRALGPSGRILIAEPMAGTRGAEPAGDAYFGFYLLAMGSGRPRTRGEIVHLLNRAGFTNAKERSTRIPLLVRVIVADTDTHCDC